MKKAPKNLLLMKPVINKNVNWYEKDSRVYLEIRREGAIDRFVQKYFKVKDKTTVELDVLGSGVWKFLDGKRNVFEISKLVDNEFGEKAAPLVERLAAFIRVLKDASIIRLEEEKNGNYTEG